MLHKMVFMYSPVTSKLKLKSKLYDSFLTYIIFVEKCGVWHTFTAVSPSSGSRTVPRPKMVEKPTAPSPFRPTSFQSNLIKTLCGRNGEYLRYK